MFVDVISLPAYRFLKAAHEYWYDMEDLDAAMVMVEQALYTAPDFTEALLLKAELLYELDAIEDAFDVLDTLLKNTPDCLEGYLAKVAMLISQGRRQAALAICGEAFRYVNIGKESGDWVIPYLFRHKLALQMALNRAWAAKQTLKLAQQCLPEEEIHLLQNYLNELSRHYRLKQKQRPHLKALVT